MNLDLTKLMAGNWLGSLVVAVVMLTTAVVATIIVFVVGVLAFRRMVRSYPSVLPALGDVLRVALFTAEAPSSTRSTRRSTAVTSASPVVRRSYPPPPPYDGPAS